MMPVGCIAHRDLDDAFDELEVSRRVAVGKFVRQSLTLDFRVAPRVCEFPAAQWLGGSAVVAEVVAYAFELEGSSLMSIVFGFILARFLRQKALHKAPVILAIVVSARFIGLNPLFPLIATLFSYLSVKVGQT